jgi:CRP-like cAMP-binding protein
MPSSASGIPPEFETARTNRFLAALRSHDYSLLAPHLRVVELERGAVLHDVGEPIEYVYFPHSGMVSLVTIMLNGGAVETATMGRTAVIGGNTGLGSRRAIGRAIVQLPGTASRLPASQFHAIARQSDAIHELAVRYNDVLIAQIQQSVACNALHTLEARLCRWLLRSLDCIDSNIIPLTQEFLAQMLGVRRTSVTLAARTLQSAGLIRYRRGQIQVIDRAGLEHCACECYAAVRERIDEIFPTFIASSVP